MRCINDQIFSSCVAIGASTGCGGRPGSCCDDWGLSSCVCCFVPISVLSSSLSTAAIRSKSTTCSLFTVPCWIVKEFLWLRIGRGERTGTSASGLLLLFRSEIIAGERRLDFSGRSVWGDNPTCSSIRTTEGWLRGNGWACGETERVWDDMRKCALIRDARSPFPASPSAAERDCCGDGACWSRFGDTLRLSGLGMVGSCWAVNRSALEGRMGYAPIRRRGGG